MSTGRVTSITIGEIGIYEELGSEMLVPIMLKTPAAWNLVSAFASKVRKIKMAAK